jgi:hypothetical protein
MSGALISLVSKGAQDVYLNGDFSFFKTKYSRYTNFAQAPKLLNMVGGAIQAGGTTTIQIDSYGDLINGIWLHGGEDAQSEITSSKVLITGYITDGVLTVTSDTTPVQGMKLRVFIAEPPETVETYISQDNHDGTFNLNTDASYGSSGDPLNMMAYIGTDSPPGLVGCLPGTIFDLYIGGQLIDSQTFDFMSDIWNVYLADTSTKRSVGTNFMSTNPNLDYTFVPLHFFFCDNEMFLPLVAIQYHAVEIRVRWGPWVDQAGPIQAYGNYVFLDTNEREEMVAKPMDLLVTQVQRSIPNGTLDLSVFNHPVKSIYFGYPSVGWSSTWDFASADFLLNGTYILEKMYPAYFHTVQGYYHTKHGSIQFASDPNFHSPTTTQYYNYNFCLDATSYRPTGTCNFSRLDNARIHLTQPEVYTADGYTPLTPLTMYAVNYNVLRVKAGMAGILFGN